ncbi:KAP family P-loop NTPase fold protein [Shewanella algae]|uniref:KAP family P-loop NTPase fold protein n=1 Tax=Shewanella algae TaxID=38313 RepID=UPI0031F49050
MENTTKFNWDNGITINDEFFPEDKLQRSRYAEFLTRLLESQGFDKTKEPEFQKKNYVLNLNSEWGSGKTYFLKRWVEDIKSDHPVVYVDAWAKDYSDDPLMTVISAIIKQLREQAGKPEDNPIFKAPRKLIGLLKAAAPGIARGITKRYLGIDPVKIMKADDGDELGKVKDQNGNEVDMSFAASEAVKYLLDEHEAKSNAIDDLKKSVQEWVNAVVGIKQISYPAFIFIDELDRCRPSYAIEMLETIKHIFNIKGIVFVVATDTEQLQHTIKAVYGEGFNAKVYLNRFFNSSYALKRPEITNLLNVHIDVHKFSPEYFKEREIKFIPYNDSPEDTLKNIATVLNVFRISIRNSIQLTERIVATVSNLPKGSSVDLLMLVILCCVREKDIELFNDLLSGRYRTHRTDNPNLEKLVSDYIIEMTDVEKLPSSLINMKFNPKEVFPYIKEGKNSKINQYGSNDYSFKLHEYFEHIIKVQFNSMRPIDKTYYNSEEEMLKAAKELISFWEPPSKDMCVNSFSISFNWLKYMYYVQEFDKITIEEYRDFIELASPLNWMGLDEIRKLIV